MTLAENLKPLTQVLRGGWRAVSDALCLREGQTVCLTALSPGVIRVSPNAVRTKWRRARVQLRSGLQVGSGSYEHAAAQSFWGTDSTDSTCSI